MNRRLAIEIGGFVDDTSSICNANQVDANIPFDSLTILTPMVPYSCLNNGPVYWTTLDEG